MLHNSTLVLTKVKSNLEEALGSQLIMMQQNSGRAGQFAPQFVSICEAIDWVEKIIGEPEVQTSTDETVVTATKKKTVKTDTN